MKKNWVYIFLYFKNCDIIIKGAKPLGLAIIINK